MGLNKQDFNLFQYFFLLLKKCRYATRDREAKSMMKIEGDMVDNVVFVI